MYESEGDAVFVVAIRAMPHEPRAPLPLPHAAPLAVPPGFDDALASAGIACEAATLVRIGAYLAYLRAANEHLNLTAITDPDAMWSRHALDALSVVPLLADVTAGARLVDVGSGGGVPGLVLAIVRPDLDVVLVEATAKKAAFLEGVAAAIGLDNVRVEAARAEDLVRGPLARSAKVVTARAVARLKTLLGWTAPFAAPGGRLLLIKGQKANEELGEARRDLARAGCTHVETRVTSTGRVIVLRVR